MIEADELDIARDELLYLVADCPGFIEAHNLLAMLALEEEILSALDPEKYIAMAIDSARLMGSAPAAGSRSNSGQRRPFARSWPASSASPASSPCSPSSTGRSFPM